MKTILITGAGGFLGSHVLEQALDATDWHAVCVDSFRHNGATDRITSVIDTVGGDAAGRVTVLTHDLAAPLSIRQLTSLEDVDYVVHAAARCSVDDSIASPREHVLDNVAATLTVLEMARYVRPEIVLHVSTDEVFGPDLDYGVDLKSHAPSSPYAASKAACEDVCRAYGRTYGVPVAAVNSANLLGERQSQLAFVPRLVRLLLDGEPISIHARAGRPGSRWYTYAPNLARHLVDVLARGERLTPPRWRYPVRGQEILTNLELARRVAAILGAEGIFNLVEAADQRPGWDDTYAELPADTDWSPEVGFDDGLALTVRWLRDHPEWLE